MLKIRLLSENYARKRHMLAEHGLSIWIEADNKNILFDTGQSDIFSHNARHAGIDISKADMLVISHGHYDHTGGVPEFCRINEKAPIYVHQGAFSKRYYGLKEPGINIGILWVVHETGELNIPFERLVMGKGPVLIGSNIVISGEIPVTVAFEEAPNNFYIDDGNGKLSQDLIVDERILIIEGCKGIYIFAGCSHAGVINCIKYAQKLFPGKKIAGIIAGMHLENVTDTRLKMTIRNFLDHDIETVVPLHCTGMLSICEMKRLLKERCKMPTVGDEIIFEE